MISLLQLGTVDYATGLRLQQQLIALRKEEKIGDVLLLLEHSPVITLGRNARAANVVASPNLLEKRGVELFECDRGGDVTFHGPGQIVGYPIFDLRSFATPEGKRKTLGVVEFVRRLEDVLMRTCADFAIPTKRVAGLTGVWTDTGVSDAHGGTDAGVNNAHGGTDAPVRSVERSSTAPTRANNAHGGTDAPVRSVERSSTALTRANDAHGGTDALVRSVERSSTAATSAAEAKLAAIGVHISRFVTSHGFALNVNTDLSFFNLIIPCGITSKPVTSMQQQLSRPLDLDRVAESISRNFGVVFHSQILWVDTLDALLRPSLDLAVQASQPLGPRA